MLKSFIRKHFAKFSKDEAGVSAVEYAILASGIGGGLLIGVDAFYGDGTDGLSGVFAGLLTSLGI